MVEFQEWTDFQSGLDTGQKLKIVNNFNLTESTAGKKYFVSRNVTASGDGLTWDTAFKTITEAVTAVNAAYAAAAQPNKGRNNVIYVGEGWYAETPITLTASDTYIIGTAPGTHDSIVLYGVPVAGTFSGVAGGPALTVHGSNNTIMNMGFYTSDVLYPSVQNGGAAGDYGGYKDCYGNKYINCTFVRDVADGSIGGILTSASEGPEIVGCRFSTSCKDYGIKIKSNGVTNPVGVWIKDCKFIGTETGIIKTAGSDCIVDGCLFIDDTTDRADAITTPVTNEGNQLILINNFWEFSDANAITGGGDHLNINNNTLAKT